MTEPNPDNPTAEFNLTFGDETVTVVLEYHFSDNAEDFFDVSSFVEMSASATMLAIKGSVTSE